MIKPFKTISIVSLIALTGCVTAEQINAGVGTFEGRPYQEAFAKLGFPDEEQRIAGHTVYVWANRNSGSYTLPTTQTATTYVGGQAIYTTVHGSSTESYDHHCRLKLVVNSEGTVVSAEADGNIGGCEHYAALAPKKAK